MQKRIEDLEQAGKTVQPWHIGVMEWMKIYFDDLEAGVVAPRWP